MMRIAAVIAIVLMGCPPDPAPDPKPTPKGATCADVCAHGAEMHCLWAEPTPKGATCREVCENAQEWQGWNLDCRASALNCESTDACDVGGP